MSILFKGNLEEGNYTLIKTTDGWVLKGETSYVGFNFTDKPTGEWVKATGMMPPEFHGHHCCSVCGGFAGMEFPYGNRENFSDYCPNCGARMGGDDE